MQAFDKSSSLFPVVLDHVDLATCSIGPMYGPAARAAQAFIQAHSEKGMLLRAGYGEALDGFRTAVASLLGVDDDDVTYVSNTAEGIGLIANGYPFAPGDQVLSYVHEFPSNHYPWVLQQGRGVELHLLSDSAEGCGIAAGRPRGWSFDELTERTSERTRMIALSHVQFASGYRADIERLARFCRDREIDLVIDAAQSLGALPLHPAELGISAVVSSAWKWLLASRGAGLMYVSPELRAKLRLTMAGDASMRHRLDYLEHAWDPVESARRFEYSTLPWEHLVAIETSVSQLFLRYGVAAIEAELMRLQDVFVGALTTPGVRPVRFEHGLRSGILACDTDRDPKELVARLADEGIVATAQGGYLRVAPHFFVDDDALARVAEVLNRLA